MQEVPGSSDSSWNFDSKYFVSMSGMVSVRSDVEGDVEKLLSE